MKFPAPLLLVLTAATLVSCGTARKVSPREELAGRLASYAAEKKIAYGHQDDLAYGHTWKVEDWENDPLLRSDVKSATGMFPMVVGFDLGGIETAAANNLDGVPFGLIRKAARLHTRRGGIVTFSWHPRNPLTGGDAWDTSSPEVVRSILSGGVLEKEYHLWLERLGDFLLSVGRDVPVVFRPYHEHLGSWFWWGKDLCTEDEYKELFRMTWNYLVKERGLDNLLWCYSPNGNIGPEEFLSRYPGDEYVDIMGFDTYSNLGGRSVPEAREVFREKAVSQLTYLTALAREHGKLLCFAETGQEGLQDPKWWTETLLPVIRGFPICYVLTWRNAHDKPSHFYAAWEGFEHAADMRDFSRCENVLFLPVPPDTAIPQEESAPTPARFSEVYEKPFSGAFPLAGETAAAICFDKADFPVVGICAEMLADDILRITGKRPASLAVSSLEEIPAGPAVIAGTIGQSALVDTLIRDGLLQVNDILGKWESSVVQVIPRPDGPLLVIAGSDRRGTAYGLTSLSRAVGVSPWYWWADVTPPRKAALYVQPGRFVRKEPAVQYRGIFINDERFGGWARWAEQTFEAESGKVGPKTYRKVFELLLRLGGNLLWPAMHNGTQAFNADPENARLADSYAIVMGSSHCEQMLRNNEDEWKNAGTWGDFNYITNRPNMLRYWEERVRSNGKYENIYTLGLRGIHDYPMEGARTTEERVSLMQQAVNDQRDLLKRHIDTPIERIPQVLCTYEEVLEAYQNGLIVPDDVTLLWSDDKQGYTRNLSNPREQQRSGGAGIYYHLSYHGDPASWIWLSPLSPAFISTELSKAYSYGAKKIWVFNVGDIKPAEKEISFAMDLAWEPDRWRPEKAAGYIREWFSAIFGEQLAARMAPVQEQYYRLMASGKDSHVWFIDYSENDVLDRLAAWKEAETEALSIGNDVPEPLKNAYFELFLYPVRGASLLNRYQLLAKSSMAHAATQAQQERALQEAAEAKEAYAALNEWTRIYNETLLDGKWNHFFSWQPYHWFRSERMDAPVADASLIETVRKAPQARFVSVREALSDTGAAVFTEKEGDLPVWIEAVSPIQNFSKAPEDNAFCTVSCGEQRFTAAATPINNIWHARHVGPMWSRVGSIHLNKGGNQLRILDLKPDARLERLYLGIHPPLEENARAIIPASSFSSAQNNTDARITVIPGLGFDDGVLCLPFTTPSYETVREAPSVTYEIELTQDDRQIEIRTLPTLHVYEGRDERYAVQLDEEEPQVFSIHTEDFSAQWRKNVLRGYASGMIKIPAAKPGKHVLRIYFLDPGIVLQEIRICQRNF